MILTLEKLKMIMSISSKSPDIFIPYIDRYLPKYGIDSKQRISHFIAQIIHESGSFRFLKEIGSGQQYEGRQDLGNILPGDGPLYKGRGLIQITGRTNYLECSKAIFEDDRLIQSPELLETSEYAVSSACWFWETRGLNEYADKPDDWRIHIHRLGNLSPIGYITYRINGGQYGIKERSYFYNKALQIL